MNASIQLRKLLGIATLFLAIILSSTSAIAAQVVDINRADAATMIENWKGIGDKKARAIVSYRKKNGPFKDINDLANVKGIGEGLIKNNRKYMSLTKGVSKPSGNTKSSAKTTAKKSTSSDTKTSKQKPVKKDTSKKSTSKKSTTKKSTSTTSKDKKSTSKKSKTKKCKPGSKDKNCKPSKKKKKKSST